MKSNPAAKENTMSIDPRYARTQTRFELVGRDGMSINYSVSEHMLNNGYADRYPGSKVITHVEQREVCAYEKVLIDSGIDSSHWPALCTDMQRFLNSSPDAGRPSDAMRSAINAFNRKSVVRTSKDS